MSSNVAEVVLVERRGRPRDLELRRTQKVLREQRKAGLRRMLVRPPATYVKQQARVAKAEAQMLEARLLARAPPEAAAAPALLLVLRTAPPWETSPRVERLLRLLRLAEDHQAVFLRGTPRALAALSALGGFLAYGPLRPDTLRDLLYKRGYLMPEAPHVAPDGAPEASGAPGAAPIPVSDNTLIEARLGHLDVLCLEDVIAALAGGAGFAGVNRALAPLRLPPPPAPVGGAHAPRPGGAQPMDRLVREALARGE